MIRKGLSIIALVFLVYVIVSFYMGHEEVSQYDHLEQNANKIITGSELQTWATNLLDSYPPTNTWFILTPSELGTNFPQQLLGIASHRLGPYISVYLLKDRPRSLRLWWGSGFLGASGFEIGPTNFVSNDREWQPGVYFFSHN